MGTSGAKDLQRRRQTVVVRVNEVSVYSLFSAAKRKTRPVTGSWSIICSSGTRLSRRHRSHVTDHIEWRALLIACSSIVPPREIAEQFGH
jgi:hypothetical protein